MKFFRALHRLLENHARGLGRLCADAVRTMALTLRSRRIGNDLAGPPGRSHPGFRFPVRWFLHPLHTGWPQRDRTSSGGVECLASGFSGRVFRHAGIRFVAAFCFPYAFARPRCTRGVGRPGRAWYFQRHTGVQLCQRVLCIACRTTGARADRKPVPDTNAIAVRHAGLGASNCSASASNFSCRPADRVAGAPPRGTVVVSEGTAGRCRCRTLSPNRWTCLRLRCLLRSCRRGPGTAARVRYRIDRGYCALHLALGKRRSITSRNVDRLLADIDPPCAHPACRSLRPLSGHRATGSLYPAAARAYGGIALTSAGGLRNHRTLILLQQSRMDDSNCSA